MVNQISLTTDLNVMGTTIRYHSRFQVTSRAHHRTKDPVMPLVFSECQAAIGQCSHMISSAATESREHPNHQIFSPSPLSIDRRLYFRNQFPTLSELNEASKLSTVTRRSLRQIRSNDEIVDVLIDEWGGYRS